MSKKYKVKNKSTELFFDLAKRSFEVSWSELKNIHGGDIKKYIDNACYMSAVVVRVINHITDNFESFIQQEGNHGSIDEVDLKTVTELLVMHSYLFVRKSL